jgi:ABC-2 type transport system ATP-binding protein
VHDLRKQYSAWFGATVQAVDGVSFSVTPGTITGLIGPNGAGKSTILQCLLGLLQPTQGTVSLFGQPPRTQTVRRRIGYLAERFQTYGFLTATEMLRLFGGFSDLSPDTLDRRVPEVLDQVGLPDAADQRVASFSKGMNQRLGMAQALLHDPDLLILDEPFTGLDPHGRRIITNVLRQERAAGTTILYSSHILSDVEDLCDHILLLDDGQMALSGALNELLADHAAATLEELYMHTVVDAQ